MRQPPSPRKTKAVARIKRAYEPVAEDDGLRILVDRLWPRGLTKEKARIDLWLKDVAPSETLRRRFHGHPDKWREFVAGYRRELAHEPAKTVAEGLRERLQRDEPVTLVYAARDEEHNNAVALKSWLERRR